MNGVGRVVRILGVEVALHPGWLLGFALLTVVLALAGLPVPEPGQPAAAVWGTAALVAVFLLASIFVHEVAHAVVARRLGLRPPPVTLFGPSGGAGPLDPGTERPTDELLVAASGPVVSLAAGALFAGLGLGIAEAVGEGGPAGTAAEIALLVAVMNGVLGALNLLPAFPFDSGRILRAALWRASGDLLGATRTVANAGRALGFMSIGAGLLVAVSGDATIGLTGVIGGWFLTRFAGASYRRMVIQRHVAGLRVGEVMDRSAPSVLPHLTLDVFVEQYLLSGTGSAFAVVSGGELIGTIDVEQARRVPRDQWPTRRVVDEMILLANVETAAEDELLWPVIERFERERLRVMPVVEGSRLLGVLTREGLADLVRGRLRAVGT